MNATTKPTVVKRAIINDIILPTLSSGINIPIPATITSTICATNPCKNVYMANMMQITTPANAIIKLRSPALILSSSHLTPNAKNTASAMIKICAIAYNTLFFPDAPITFNICDTKFINPLESISLHLYVILYKLYHIFIKLSISVNKILFKIIRWPNEGKLRSRRKLAKIKI